MIDSVLSQKFYKMSFVAACLVVFIHIPIDAQADISRLFLKWFQSGICGIAVPWFFIMSGFFLADKYSPNSIYETYKKLLFKRCRTLLIPYFIFNSIAILLKRECVDFLAAYGFSAVAHPAYHLLWYIRTLFIYVVISPVFIRISTKRKSFFFLLVLFLAYCAWTFFRVRIPNRIIFGLFDVLLSIRGLFFFYLGMHIRIYDELFFVSGCRKKWLLLGLGLLVIDGTNGHLLSPFYLPLIIFGLFANIGATRQWPVEMLRNSFALYLLHGLFLYGVRIFVFPLIFNSCGVSSVFGFFLLGGIAIAFCLFGAEVFRRFLPLLYGICFGGR